MRNRLGSIWRCAVACAVAATCALFVPALAVAEVATSASSGITSETVQNPDGSTTETTITTGDDGMVTKIVKTVTDVDNGDGTITRTTVTTTTVSVPTVSTSSVIPRTSSRADTTFTYPTTCCLESASDFAVIARDYHNDNDMEGTVAAQRLHVGNPTIGNASNEDYGSNILYLESIDNISQLTSIRAGANLIVGDNIKITYDYNNGNGVTFTDSGTGQSVSYNDLSHFKSVNNVSNSSYQIDFDELWSGFYAYAAANTAKPNTEGMVVTHTDMDDPNLATVHVQCVEGENIINVSPVPTGKVEVTGPENGQYSLVVNILADDSVPVYKYDPKFSIDGISGGYSSKAGRVLFNYGTYSGNIILTGEATTGAIFAPNATVTVDSASHNGSIIAREIYNEDCEIHQAGFVEYKNLSTTEYETTTTETTTTEIIDVQGSKTEGGEGGSSDGNGSDNGSAVLDGGSDGTTLASTGDDSMVLSLFEVFGIAGAVLVFAGVRILHR